MYDDVVYIQRFSDDTSKYTSQSDCAIEWYERHPKIHILIDVQVGTSSKMENHEQKQRRRRRRCLTQQ